jgi:glycine dehydrogenase
LHAYSRRQADDPDGNYQANKYWPPVNRVDNALGDRALICACPPMEFWEQQAAE